MLCQAARAAATCWRRSSSEAAIRARRTWLPPIPVPGVPGTRPRRLVLPPGEGDLPQALDAVAVAEEGPHLAIQRQRLLVAPPRRLVLRTPQGDVPQALDAVGLAEDGPHLA